MLEARPTPTETAEIIQWLLDRELIPDATFRKMHHMGRSAISFQSYCSDHRAFVYGGRNHLLAIKLRELKSHLEARK
jgi:hypothetical protein